MARKKIKWFEAARRGAPHPVLFIDSVLCLYQEGYFGRAHKVKWNPKNYRQFDGARWFGVEDSEKYQSVVEKASRSKNNELAKLGHEYQRRLDVFRKFADKYENVDFTKYSDKQFVDIFSKWFELTKQIWSFANDYIFLNKFAPDLITSAVAAKIPDVMKQNDYLGILFEAQHASEIRQEKINLVKIAKFKRENKLSLNSKSIEKKLNNHTKQFTHLGFYYFRGAPYTIEQFKMRLSEYANFSKKKFEQIQRDFSKQTKNTEQTKQITAKLEFDPQTVRLVELAKQWASLSNYADETYGYVVNKLQDLWPDAARRLGATYSQLMGMRGYEIIGFLETGKKMSEAQKKEAGLRQGAGNTIVLQNGKIEVFSGKAFQKYAKSQRKTEQKFKNIRQLKGQPASPGKARGSVRLVYSNHDVPRLERGEILVASMTNPTYVPAMERAGAIVTDEGGLLSHAAIVSREPKNL